eukprot:1411286-Ditylum_brightwellii.AAC.1
MHLGQLLSTIIGKSVCCILEYCGDGTKRMDHMGNWGMQFGMLIYILREECPDIGGGDDGVEK